MINIRITIEQNPHGVVITHETPSSETATFAEAQMYHMLKEGIDVTLKLTGAVGGTLKIPEGLDANPGRN